MGSVQYKYTLETGLSIGKQWTVYPLSVSTADVSRLPNHHSSQCYMCVQNLVQYIAVNNQHWIHMYMYVQCTSGEISLCKSWLDRNTVYKK